MRRFPPRGASFLRELLSGRAATWPDLADDQEQHLTCALDDHGAMPLAYDACRRGNVTGVPDEHVVRWHEAYLSTAVQNSVWLAERRKVREALRRHGIGAAVLKGAALMDSVYDSVALRPIVDIDILVPPLEQRQAVEALSSLGYDRAASDAEAVEHHVELRGRGEGGMPVAVELHRRLFASPPYDRVMPVEDVLRRALAHDMHGARLAPADGLLHLSGHLVLQHARGERLIWVADIDRIVRAHGGDEGFWDEVLDRAPESLLTRSLADALALARIWFASPVPARVASALETLAPSEEEATAYVRLRRRAPVGQEGARLIDDVKGVPGAGAKLRYAASRAAPSPAEMRSWYGLDHAWQLPVYYARRALRGVAQVARRPFRTGSAVALDPPDLWMIEHDA